MLRNKEKLIDCSLPPAPYRHGNRTTGRLPSSQPLVCSFSIIGKLIDYCSDVVSPSFPTASRNTGCYHIPPFLFPCKGGVVYVKGGTLYKKGLVYAKTFCETLCAPQKQSLPELHIRKLASIQIKRLFTLQSCQEFLREHLSPWINIFWLYKIEDCCHFMSSMHYRTFFPSVTTIFFSLPRPV